VKEASKQVMVREIALLGGWLDVGLPSWGKVNSC
jgi:hypothetical protein